MTNLSVLVIMKDNPKFIGTVAVNFRNMVRIKIGKCASFIGISTISIQLIRNISGYTNLHSNFNDNTEAQLAPDYQTKMDVSGMRADYNNKQNLFLEENLKIKEPINLFDEWFKIIKNDPRTVEANAMCLSTATKNGIPSARYVLLKGYNKEGFIFFTHYTSRKGQELEENPKAALTFYWEHHSRSVRIEGDVEKLPFSQADEYFNKRPYQSQIGALCSDQSKPVAGRNILAEKERELKNKYTEGTVPRPQLWGGYLVKPLSIEFWQGQTDRIHDRIKFRKPEKNEPDGVLTHQAEDGWVYERLNP